MVRVNTHQAKSTLSELIRLVEEKGERVQICRNGHPVAELVPVKAFADPLRVDPALKVTFKEDPSLPLDERDWGNLR